MTAFEGQVALVTGASRGIGAACAEALAAQGAHVVLTGRDTKSLEAVEQRIFEAGGNATIAPVDLAEVDGIARLAAAIAQRWGKLDMMVHCAAVLQQAGAVADIDQPGFSKALTVNVLASQALIASFDKLLRRSLDARVVLMTSPAAKMAMPYWASYAGTKAAQEMLFECYALEVRNISKVRVALLDPGAVRTAMRAKAFPGEDPASVKGPEVVAERVVGLLGEQFASPHRESVNQVR